MYKLIHDLNKDYSFVKLITDFETMKYIDPSLISRFRSNQLRVKYLKYKSKYLALQKLII
jgi:hypothetical protein